jgi:hypothetical protein
MTVLPGRRIAGAGEIIAEPGDLDQTMRERFLSCWFVVDEAIEHANFSRSQREGWRRVWGGTVEHRDQEDPPTQDAKERDQISQRLGGPELRLLSFVQWHRCGNRQPGR